MELSAIFVDKIIFRWPDGGARKTLLCSSTVIVECKGNIYHLMGPCLYLNKIIYRLQNKP